MEATSAPIQPTPAPALLIDKAFFGKDNCLTFQVRGDSAYMKWGKKAGDQWAWKNVKFSDVELGEILRVLESRQDQASFFHSFQGDSTKIWVNRQDKAVVFRAEEFTKGLQPGEQEVLAVLVRNSIWLQTMTI